jgi:hypothetical protein
MADSGLQIDRELRRIVDMREAVNEQIALLADVLRGEIALSGAPLCGSCWVESCRAGRRR